VFLQELREGFVGNFLKAFACDACDGRVIASKVASLN
jgi:hypothetical protein